MIFSVDVGYRQVKAIQQKAKIIFPSSVAHAKSFAIESLGKINDYAVNIETKDGQVKEYFVGNLAEREAAGSLITQNDRVKHMDPSHKVLILTAGRLLMSEAEASNTLVVGLPISYYKSQKDELEDNMRSIDARVSVDQAPAQNLKFDHVHVFPQGSGALMTVDDLTKNGTVCLVDIGMKTTDCVVARIGNGHMTPIASMCTSVELGVKDFYDTIGKFYQNKTGSASNFVRTLEIVERKGQVTFNRQPLDMSREIEAARDEIQQAILDRVKNSLADVWAELDEIYTAGGGASVFDTISERMGATMVQDPVWANARGFLKVGQSKAAI